jgi:uncharacterized protein YecE (DUF72 family)
MARILVGTSGWSYDHWRGPFYPRGLRAADRLGFYAARFATVEIDGTFYRLPSEDVVRGWRAAVPEGFAFAVKGSRFITHFRRLWDVDDAVASFMERMSLLGDTLRVVLWQLPPTMQIDTAGLDAFLSLVGSDVRHAVEFRHASWLVEETFDVLRAHGAAHVHVSSDDMPQDLTPTADFVYVRFHGTASYHGAYLAPALEPWARFLRDQAAAGRDGYAYFNNDAEAHAPRDAARLAGMLGGSLERTGGGADT